MNITPELLVAITNLESAAYLQGVIADGEWTKANALAWQRTAKARERLLSLLRGT